jgi:glycine/D-amino acid oxidase-like deaminating enzyme
MPADGYPSVGAVAELPGYYEAVTHSGVTLGPLIGRLLAELILADRIDPLLEPYSPNRFPPRLALRDLLCGTRPRHDLRMRWGTGVGAARPAAITFAGTVG